MHIDIYLKTVLKSGNAFVKKLNAWRVSRVLETDSILCSIVFLLHSVHVVTVGTQWYLGSMWMSLDHTPRWKPSTCRTNSVGWRMTFWLSALSSGLTRVVTLPLWLWVEVACPSGTMDTMAPLMTSEFPLRLFFLTLKDGTCSQLDSSIGPS